MLLPNLYNHFFNPQYISNCFDKHTKNIAIPKTKKIKPGQTFINALAPSNYLTSTALPFFKVKIIAI
jgi:hypothetical protein